MENIQEHSSKLVKRYADLLNLNDWDIKIKVQTLEQYQRSHGKGFGSLTNACANIYQNKHRARIFVKDTLDKETLENSILHEMVHIPINDLYVNGLMAINDIEDVEKKHEYLFDWECKLEVSVCHVTSAIYKLHKMAVDTQMVNL